MVVEDLSRGAISQLGYHFQIDPDVFLDQLFQHRYYTVRDPTCQPAGIRMDAKNRNWFQLSFFRFRYFQNEKLLDEATKSCCKFNVFRYLEDDYSKAWGRGGSPNILG